MKNISIPDSLNRKIEACKDVFKNQVLQLNNQMRRDIELLVSGWVSSLDIPDDIFLEYNHETGVLSYSENENEAEVLES